MGWKTYLLALFVMAAFVASFILCWRSETFHRLASAEEKVVIKEEFKACFDCHMNKTPGVVADWRRSKHAQNGIGCNTCHIPANGELIEEIKRVAEEREILPFSSKCEGPQTIDGVTQIVAVIPPKTCSSCHEKQYKEFSQSKHGNAWKNLLLHKQLRKECDHLDIKNCASCHKIEFSCNKCHGVHKFSLENARKPEACGFCHSGETHPQVNKYLNAAHGIRYRLENGLWDFEGSIEEWHKKLEKNPLPVPLCVTCHVPEGSHKIERRKVEDLRWLCNQCHKEEKDFSTISHFSDESKGHAYEIAKLPGHRKCWECHKPLSKSLESECRMEEM